MSKPLALVIEDRQELAGIFAFALHAAEYDTEIILDGQEAVDRLLEIVPDLILLDLHLPGVPGEKLLKLIKSTERLAKTRVFVASGDSYQAELVREKADIVLQKPISLGQLRDLALRYNPCGGRSGLPVA